MARLLTVAAFATLADACFVPWNGQDTLLVENAKYKECKNAAIADHEALCTCASDMWAKSRDCGFAWIVPWLSTVHRDKMKFCAGFSASIGSSLSGSDQSLPSSQGSLLDFSDSSTSGSSGDMTLPQKSLLLGVLAVCLCLCCGGIIAGLILARSSKGKKKPAYYDDEDQDYEQQQYDQGYPGEDYGGGVAPAEYYDQPQDMTMPPQAAPLVGH